MGIEAWVVLGIIFLCFSLLLLTKLSPDVIFVGGLTVIIVGRVVEPAEALVGFSNQGMLTIGALYVVAAGLKETGAIQFVVTHLLGRPQSVMVAQARIVGPVVTMSAFLNNTPIVAAFIPAIQEWSKKFNIPASRLMMPLSYAAILGGTCTLIGTSTNLIVNGLLISETGDTLNIFEPAFVGIPIVLAGSAYIILFGRKLLPLRTSGIKSFENTREYTIEMMVDINNSNVISGQSIEEANLRHLPGLYLVEIVRGEEILPAVSPNTRLEKGDRLIFTGRVESIVDLQKIPGLTPATGQVFKLDAPRRERVLAEAVVSQSNPLNGSTIKAGKFRNRYNAVVLAVSRRGERLNQKVGDIRLQTGDVLLLETSLNFVEKYRLSNDFYLVSTLSDTGQPDHERSWMAWLILGGMVALAASGILTMFQAAFLAAGMMLLTGCCRISVAKDSIDWSVLLVIASALGIGHALDLTGAAQTIAGGFLRFAESDPLLALAATYLATWITTEMITNNAAAVLIFPIGFSLATSIGVDYMPFVMTIMFAASASFATPIGYQTNLMVYSPGGYRFTDFLRFGLPLNLIVAVITILLVPVFWPF